MSIYPKMMYTAIALAGQSWMSVAKLVQQI